MFEENIWVAIFAKYGFSIWEVDGLRNFSLIVEQDAKFSKGKNFHYMHTIIGALISY